jgi:WD40 repeat protein
MRTVGAVVVLLFAVASPSGWSAPAVRAAHIGAPAWSADGKLIAWTEGVGAESRIWTAAPDMRGARPVSPPIDALGQIAWLPHHQILYWADFRVFRLVAGGRSSLVRDVAGDGFALDRSRTRVATGDSPCSTGCAGPVMIFDLNGRHARKVGGANAQNLSPTFSPDGKRVAFERILCARTGRCERPLGIWTASITNGKLRRVVSGMSACPSWSPNGGAIAYVDLSNPADEALRVVTVRSGRKLLLLRAVGCNLSFPPEWSPDSRSIAAVSQRTGRLLVADLKLHRRRLVTGIGIGVVTGFAWSPDSSHLLVSAQPPGQATCSSLWRVAAKTGAATSLRSC